MTKAFAPAYPKVPGKQKQNSQRVPYLAENPVEEIISFVRCDAIVPCLCTSISKYDHKSWIPLSYVMILMVLSNTDNSLVN